MKGPNQVTGANADEPRQLAMRTQLAARVAQFGRSAWKPHYIMKSFRILTFLIVCATVGLLMIGCSHLNLPPASRYRVVCGQVTYSATSVKAHGNWIELQTDQGPIWFNRDAVTSISPSR
jgi:hypothetical protein